MHCVNRIKCCDWIDDVTFLYHPGSLFPLMFMMSGCRRGEIYTHTHKHWEIKYIT